MQPLRLFESLFITAAAVIVLTSLWMSPPECRAETARAVAADPLAWPEQSAQTRPWARWWWLGSAVDEKTITKLLEQYRDAGIGGVEICPIYGAKGYEAQYVPFLSPRWMELLAHVTSEAKRLGLGVDLTDRHRLAVRRAERVAARGVGEACVARRTTSRRRAARDRLPEGEIQCVIAVSDAGRATRPDVTRR
jgi:hypothetical protein